MFLKKIFHHSVLTYASYFFPLLIGLAIKDPLYVFYQNYFAYQTQPISTSNSFAQQLDSGIDLHKQGKLQEAINAYHTALANMPEIARGLLQLAGSYAASGNHEQAIHFYQCALNLEPRFIAGYIALGMSYMQLKQYAQAINYFSIACKIAPDNIDAHLQLSKTYMDTGAYEQALDHAHQAYQLQPSNIHTLLNLGHIHNKQGTLDEAVQWYIKALELNADFANAHYNLGYTLRIMKKPHEALKHLLRALALQPNYIDSHIALAQTYWGLKDYDKAWKEYEWRWKLLGVDPYAMEAPLWNGCDLHGKTILLYCEQGLGDTIQFIRYAKMVKEKGAHIICKIQKPLISLLASYPYVDKYVTNMEEIKGTHIDYQSPLLNLPGTFKTNDETIPAQIPYLKADAKLVSLWKPILRSLSSGGQAFKIGLCWHVDPEHELDKSPWSKRNVHASMFASLAQIPRLSFYSLQKINGEDQLKNLPENFVVHTFGYNFDESHGRFMDTAAVIANLDLIITVDTSIAHIAGALGKKVWMLLPYSPDPRWYDEGDKTKWYPSMRLFRQPKPYDWQAVIKEVFEEVKKALKKEIKL